MNAKQAKDLSIFEFLKKQGINPKRIKGNKYFYFSPFRDEKDASFNIDVVKNIWYDYGSGEGGRIVDLVMKLYNINVSQALDKLSNGQISNNNQFLSFYQQKDNVTRIQVVKIKHIENKALIQYLQSRKISLKIAKIYLKEIYYKIDKKQYFSLGFENDKKGFELRNKYFKGSTSPKYYTKIKGLESDLVLNIFEGFTDFLSSLEYLKTTKLNNDTIVLNSLSFIDSIIPKLKNYAKINLFLDNNFSGIKAVNKIIKNHANVVNQSKKIYPEYEDFNDFISKSL